ncbi:MAG: zinc ribbon domain-containing protein [Sulfuricellaceae bacterium]
MPIYEYRCSSCNFQKEHMQKMNDPLLTVCPECGKETYAKMLSAAGFQLKGSGWYQSDFKGGAKPKEESAAPAPVPPCAGGGCCCAG